MITRVRKLTPLNVSALRKAMPEVTTGTTFAEFTGTPSQACDAVRSTMVTLAQTTGINTTYNSLRAVERKLAAAAPRFHTEGTETAMTNYVTVNRGSGFTPRSHKHFGQVAVCYCSEPPTL